LPWFLSKEFIIFFIEISHPRILNISYVLSNFHSKEWSKYNRKFLVKHRCIWFYWAFVEFRAIEIRLLKKIINRNISQKFLHQFTIPIASFSIFIKVWAWYNLYKWRRIRKWRPLAWKFVFKVIFRTPSSICNSQGFFLIVCNFKIWPIASFCLISITNRIIGSVYNTILVITIVNSHEIFNWFPFKSFSILNNYGNCKS